MADVHQNAAPIRFETSPERYRHWKLDFPSEYERKVARLTLDVQDNGGLRQGYSLKLNSYDLSVDIELADALSRIRFEHPEVRAIVFVSGKDRIFSAGANIYMLGLSSHTFKVNFCKFTNETRLYLEQMSAESGIASLAALNGTASGGGYELAIACDEIVLSDDGSSAVSLPEVPLLGVLPGTGGLTRLVDKRKVRRDYADVFSSLAEGVRGKRAVEWGVVDESPSRAQFQQAVELRLKAMVGRSTAQTRPSIKLTPIDGDYHEAGTRYRYVTLSVDAARRVASLTIRTPDNREPTTPAELAAKGAEAWLVRAFRELDDALLDLRFNYANVAAIEVRAEGQGENVLQAEGILIDHASDPLVREVTHLIRRVLKRYDNTARSLFALVDDKSAFAGLLFELALGADRTYMLDASGVSLRVSPMSAGLFPMATNLSRIQAHFYGDPSRAATSLAETSSIDTARARELGLVTFTPDELDWEDEVRMAFEERASLSPDALTGMEANLRFVGPETMETKIFGRLSAWQNWIFQRPNATGQKGALTLYGKPERPEFDFTRT